MPEFLICANSFAAPFVSDSSEKFVVAETPEEALELFAESYTHPCGLFAAIAFRDANAKVKGEPPLAKWLCNQELAKLKATTRMGSYSYLGIKPGVFEIDGERITVENPKKGHVVPV